MLLHRGHFGRIKLISGKAIVETFSKASTRIHWPQDNFFVFFFSFFVSFFFWVRLDSLEVIVGFKTKRHGHPAAS